MTFSNQTNVLEECRILPLSTASPTIIPLTFFDIPWCAWFSFKPVYFYEFQLPKSHFIETILPQIKHSLSLTLQHFYPLAGNLTWPKDSNKPEIVCRDGDSVLLVVAESDQDFDHLCGNHAIDVNELDVLVPKFSPAMYKDEKYIPLFSLQITLFPSKGMSIGYKFHHVVVDGRAAANFITSWANICKSVGEAGSDFIPDDLLPCLDKSMVKDPKGMELKYVNGGLEQYIIKRENLNLSNMPMGTAPFVDTFRATFVMDCSKIKRLKQYVLAHFQLEDQTAPSFHTSTLVLTLAYVWICLIKSRWGENDDSEEMEHLIQPVDCRARLDPPLPVSYFGNCLGTIAVMEKRRDLIGKDGIAIAAKLIGTKIQEIKECVWKALEVGTLYIKTVPRDKLVTTSSSPRFGSYKRDFGWGNPKKVVPSFESMISVSLVECPYEEGAIEVGLVRNKIEMDAFTSFFHKTIKTLA